MKMMNSDRREILKSAAMAAAGSLVTGGSLPVVQADPGVADLPDGEGLTWNKAPCRFCGTGCHVQVGVEDGRVVAVAGDKAADVNKGLLCVKGYHVGGILYGEDRLTEPLLRQDDGTLKAISWDEALDIIAKRIFDSPQTFAFYGSGQWTIPEGFAAQKFMKGGLSNNHIDPNARLCMASAVTGFLGTYGVDEPAGCYQDLDECDVLITWGNNPAEMHPVLFSRVTDRRSRGEKVRIIDIGTRRTRTTDAANEYLNMKPHGDVAIALGIMHLLIENNTYDTSFVKDHCNFRAHPESGKTLMGEAISEDEFRKRIAEYTPERVSELSGLSVEQIRMLGDLFGDRNIRITSLWCMGMNQHTMGTAINTLVHGVHLLSGHFGKPGDSPTSLTGQPSACGTVREVGTLSHALPGGRVVANPEHRQQCEEFWNVPEGRINGTPGYHTVKMFDQFTMPTDEGGDITTMFVQVTNPGQTLPNLNKLFNDKEQLADKFLIVSDVYPTPTTALANLILPAAMWVEKNGMFGNSERRTQQWFKMVDPPGDARDDCWMTIAIARKLFEMGHEGMQDKDGEFIFAVKDESGEEIPIWEFEHYYDTNVDKHLFEEYRQFTTMKHKNLAPYEEYVKARGLRWPVVEQQDGSWRETRFRFSGFDDPFVAEGEEFDFYHSSTKDGKAQIWFHDYEPPPEMPDEDYPLWLCTGRVLEHWHTGSMTRRVTQLSRAMPTGYVEMNKEDAKDANIRQGETVVVESRRGSCQLPVWIDGRGRPPRGTIFVPFFDETKMINNVTLEAYCPISKQPDYKKCAARVRKMTEADS
ncbi:molybdopterin-dependent oxidoreductase [Rhodopirellula sallentina]|uniref:Nitrate reductase n=1 Tax=Rhodopirellula sallentina SM41 TaxID=1263870 RepID=M5TXQ6_9BACT|nr:molybdopterin-dependent oxidoreductase [Rhodopirellula sallentina]EMI53970.1 periplasmic nitrate reductase, large subunit [Rhodopirellula sallentina SM41]